MALGITGGLLGPRAAGRREGSSRKSDLHQILVRSRVTLAQWFLRNNSLNVIFVCFPSCVLKGEIYEREKRNGSLSAICTGPFSIQHGDVLSNRQRGLGHADSWTRLKRTGSLTPDRIGCS